ncbi:MAG: hypothetical protein DBX05_04020 [Candidatus Poseidoniales archaeon]|nr:MAG: hypothetical protein CBE15_06875 [Euryarchaeota archaeon TMED255]RAH11494.1 MAG: hypothetical protein CMA23_001950 [Euryarchaeota archaeon]RCH73686.1 MAG: hypothetical protein DBX05_04020 [Candidatus Poseidoniales archaeon]
MSGFDDVMHHFNHHRDEIKTWLEGLRKDAQLPLYGSFDIRDAGWKASVVDANAFPAGFNNISPEDYPFLAAGFVEHLHSYLPNGGRVLLWPEAHTRNDAYLENVFVLRELLESNDITVHVGTDELPPMEIDVSGGILQLGQVDIEKESILVDGNPIDLIVLNSDLTTGPLLIDSVPILPVPSMGWYNRSKCEHFEHVKSLVHQLAEMLGIDPWLIGPWGFVSRGRCLEEAECRERLAAEIELGLDFISSKYSEHGIDATPSLFMKNDRGTYGLGILRIDSPEDILNLSKRKMNRLTYGRGGVQAEDFLLQEAVPTHLRSGSGVIEPVGYGVNGLVLSWFHRFNLKHGPLDNLNTPSTSFILDSDLDGESVQQILDRRFLHRTLAEISMIAMTLEAADHSESGSD